MRNIVLIGFMGSGKTVVSKVLSKKLKMKIKDTDELIEKKTKLKIKEIFAKYGEEYFREIEKKVVSNVSKRKNIIISTGGGIVKNELNIKNLKKNGIIVYLKNSFLTSVKRLKNKKDRPLFDHQNLKNTKKLFNLRQKLYKNAADIIIKTDNKSIKEVAKEIIEKIKKLEKNKNDNNKS
jgi:shikimate kinase